MDAYPTLAVVVVTYNRTNALHTTLAALFQHLYYVGPKHLIVTDDGSTDGTQDMIASLAMPDGWALTLVQNHRRMMGGNTNAGLYHAFTMTDYVLQLQDDMQLTQSLDLHPHIDKLHDDPTAGFIRLWGVGGHAYHGAMEGNYLRVWWHSPELHIPSDRPHVKHRRFHNYFGFYPEGLPSAETEATWCHQCKARSGANSIQMDVLVPVGTETERNWVHQCWDQRWRDQGL